MKIEFCSGRLFSFFYHIMLVVLVFTTLSLSADSEQAKEVKITPASYDYQDKEISDSSNDNRHRDPERKKLTDGILKAPSRIIWDWRSIGRRKPVEITFRFQLPETLSKVIVHINRGPRAYGIKSMALYGLLPDGSNIPLASKTLNQPYTKPEDEPDYSSVEITVESDKKVSEVLLKVEGEAYVGLTEVEFFKKSSAASKQTVYGNPFDFLGENVSLSSGLRIVEKDFNKDGNMDILLENNYMIYVVEPRFGGVINYAYDKRAKKNLVKYHDTSAWGGVFCDFVKRDGRNAFDWMTAPYQYKIISRGPENVSIQLWKAGASGHYAMLEMDKTFTLNVNSTELKADYLVKLSPDNVTAMDFAFFSFSAFGASDENWQLFYPEKDGVKTSKKGESDNVWGHDPSQGWNGFVTDSGCGAAIVSEYERLASHHFWPVNTDSSVEAIFGQFPVEAGDAFKTTLYLVPFYGVGGVPDAVSSFMAAKIDSQGKYSKAPSELALKVKPSQAGEYTILIEKKLLPDGQWEKLFDKTQTLSIDPATINFPFKADKTGTYVIKATVKLGEQIVLTAEHPLSIGTPSGEFLMSSPCERIIPKVAEKKEPELDFNSTEHVTPHVKWATSYAGGSPVVLFLVQEGGSRGSFREIIEIAQRFEMEPHSSYIPLADNKTEYYQLADHLWSLGPDGYLKHLEKMLGEDKKYDAMVIAGNYWKILKDSLKNDIIARVENGMGLVLLYPLEAPEKLSTTIKISDEKRFKAPWKKAKEHFITSGIPFDALPQSNVFNAVSAGDVLATANGKPLIVTGSLGKGRIVAAAWDGGPLNRSGYFYTYSAKNLLPKLSVLGDDGKKFDYWEYQISLLAKMIYYAADKMPAISGNSMQISGNKLKLELNNSSSNRIKVNAAVTIRDKYYRIESEKKVDLELAPGKNNIDIAIEKTALGGVHLVDLIINADQKTQWWGTTTFELNPDAEIKTLAFGKNVYKRNEQATLNVEIKGKVSGNSQLKISAKDAYGRVFAEVSTKPKSGKNSFFIPVKDCIGQYLEVDAKLIDSTGKINSEERISGYVFTEMATDRFNIMVGWPGILYRSNLFLAPLFYDIYKEWGWSASWLPRFYYKQEAPTVTSKGVTIAVTNMSSYTIPGGKNPDKTVAAKGKYGLLRQPCLSDKTFRKKLEDSHAREIAGEELGATSRIMPDEANSIGKWQGCFSEHCRKEFREWLKKQYSSLDVLNHEWDSNFKAWDEVEAKLDTEISSKKSIAAWLDHRTFNAWNFANAHKLIADGIKKAGKNSHIMMCGTQETEVYNAYDWYLLAKYVNYYNSYAGEQSVMRRSFMDDFVNYTWVGYGNNLAHLRRQVFSRMFCDNARGYILLADVSINPDWSLHSTGKDLITLKNDFNEGRGELILRSKFEPVSVAFHYSPASIYVDSFYNLYNVYTSNIAGAKDVLRMIGDDYVYVAYGQIEENPEILQKYKIVFLPLSTALSDKEIAAFKKFVADGGTLVADFLPGGWTQHGRKRDKNPMEEIFGISSDSSEIKTLSGSLFWNESKDTEINISTVQAGLKLSSAKALATIKGDGQKQHPAVIINKYGKGNTILLCGDFMASFANWKEMKYTTKRKPATEKLLANTRKLLKSTGVTLNSSLLNSDEQQIPLTSVYRRDLGKIKLFAVVRESSGVGNKAEKGVLPLGNKYYVYKVLYGKHEFLGHADKAEFETSPETQVLLAALPYKVEGLILKARQTTIKRGTEATFDVSLKTSPAGEGDAHVVWVQFVDPTGKERKEYEQALSLKNGKSSFPIPFALNDPLGEWTISATDVATAGKIEIKLRLE